MAKAAGNSDSPDRQLPRQSSTLLGCRSEESQSPGWQGFTREGPGGIVVHYAEEPEWG